MHNQVILSERKLNIYMKFVKNLEYNVIINYIK
jgi:hypothetical protein